MSMRITTAKVAGDMKGRNQEVTPIIRIIIIGRMWATTIIIIPQIGIMPNTIITPVITIIIIIIMFPELIIIRATTTIIIIITVHKTTTVIIIITVIMFQMVRETPTPLITIIIVIITGITQMEVITIITGLIAPILTTSERKAVDRGGTSLNEGADIRVRDLSRKSGK